MSVSDEETVITVWGAGYIGFSTFVSCLASGLDAQCYDPNVDRVTALRANPDVELPGLSSLAPIPPEGYAARLYSDPKALSTNSSVHVIAVPTERDGAPNFEHLNTAGESAWGLVKSQHRTVTLLIESTVTTSAIDELVSRLAALGGVLNTNYKIVVAPRRDWLGQSVEVRASMIRVVGASSSDAIRSCQAVLNAVSPHITVATDHYHAALTKSVENTLRHISITFANELSAAFPRFNVQEVLQLAGTKWNMETYYPSLGIGGYCVPLAPRYLLQDAERPENLTLARESVARSDFPWQSTVSFIKSTGLPTAVILGLTYLPETRISDGSPAINLALALVEGSVEVLTYDPRVRESATGPVVPGSQVLEQGAAIAGPYAVVVSLRPADVPSYAQAWVQGTVSNAKVVIDPSGGWAQFTKDSSVAIYQSAHQRGWLNWA